MEDINVEQLKAKLDAKEDFLFLDVREPHEYAEANLNAKNIPLGNIMQSLDELAEYKDKEIIIHCRSGARSGMAKDMLSQNGYTKVRNVLGGILDWHEKFGK